MRKTCFFCSEIIESNITQEHIIPNSLLGELGIKEESITGEGEFLYSRIKVPAHKHCNNNFGSEYENKVLKLLEDPKSLYDKLKEEDYSFPVYYSPDDSPTSLISTWLSKIYYGLFYNDFLKLPNSEYRGIAEKIINSRNFKIIQNAYRDGVGFCLPSTLFVFESENENFDLRTFADPQMIMIKIKKLIFILSIEDGFLTKNYLNGDSLSSFREYLLLEEKRNSEIPLQVNALAEITALRMNIPKSPSFIYSKNQIMNMSLSTMVKNPNEYYKVDEELILEYRNKILEGFGIKFID